VIIEHEIIEQIEEEPNGRPLAWVCALARQLGRQMPLVMLEKMLRAGYLALHDDGGHQIAPWKCEEIWRSGQEAEEQTSSRQNSEVSGFTRESFNMRVEVHGLLTWGLPLSALTRAHR
jgi:hypothetical protein